MARLGGDEFAVLLPGTDEVAAVRVADRLRDAMDAPLAIAGHPVSVDVSTGIALAPAQGTDATTLLRYADVAMYEAKASGAGCAVYRAERDGTAPAGSGWPASCAAPSAPANCACTTSRSPPAGAGISSALEALVRWQHPEHGLLPPGKFVPLAEALG